jgi:hypothetical protein
MRLMFLARTSIGLGTLPRAVCFVLTMLKFELPLQPEGGEAFEVLNPAKIRLVPSRDSTSGPRPINLLYSLSD